MDGSASNSFGVEVLIDMWLAKSLNEKECFLKQECGYGIAMVNHTCFPKIKSQITSNGNCEKNRLKQCCFHINRWDDENAKLLEVEDKIIR